MMRCAPLISIVAQSVSMGADLAAGDAPQRTGAVQVIQTALWMTSEPSDVTRDLVVTAIILVVPRLRVVCAGSSLFFGSW
jgi:hypothetical protein